MKLQQLIIHNIASIEDATIDFESQPLAGSEVFLITGKTGAGKSTLLDAICLALYANTPRLENTQMQGDTQDGDRKVQIYDPRQLMRRNTGEASVSLTFIGSNNIPYEAVWSVARARKKPTGNIQSKEWQLTNLRTHTTLTKDKEIEAEIKAAIGLDFNQFCRTTLLAQGEFTRFLNSKDDEKAEILEKITGVDIYSKIGAKVFAIARQKEMDYAEAQRKTEHIVVLSETEIAEKKAAIQALTEAHEQLRSTKTTEEQKQLWLKTEAEIAGQVQQAEANYKQAKEQLESEEFLQTEQLVKAWHETLDARNHLRDMQQATDTVNRLNAGLATLKERFVQLRAGEQWRTQQWEQLGTEVKALSSFLESEKKKAPVYENAQTIAACLHTIIDGRKKREETAREMETESKRLEGSLKEQWEKATAVHREAGSLYRQKAETLQQKEEELEAIGLSTLRKQKEEKREKIAAIQTAYERINIFNTEKERQALNRQAQQTLHEAIINLQQQEEELKPQVREAEIRRDICKGLLEEQRQTVDKWAKSIRQRLKEGDVCPVCRQTLHTALPHEEELDELFATADKAFRQAELLCQQRQQQLHKLQADIQSQTAQYERNQAAMEQDTTLAKRQAEALEACLQCGVENLDGDPLLTLNQQQKQLQAEEESLSHSIKEAEIKELAVKSERLSTSSAREAEAKAKEGLTAIEKQRDDCRARLSTLNKLIESTQADIEKAEAQVAQWVITDHWQHHMLQETKEFMEELTASTRHYTQQLQQIQEKEHALQTLQTVRQNEEEAFAAIGGLMPHWNEAMPDGPLPITDLLTKAHALHTQVKSAQDQLHTAQQNGKAAKEKLHSFCQQHPDITTEYLATLSAYTYPDIERLNNALQQSHNSARDKLSALNMLLTRQQEHRKLRPELTEADTPESIALRIGSLETQMTELNEQKGGLSLQLQQDAQHKEALGLLIAEAESKKAEYRKWSRINQLIGDATGNKFRKVAQSYVLASLIHSANSYMKSLTDRYTLRVAPGTFVITLEDAYQGFTRRAASTLSGGESFLVSLSLALALSDIGQQLAVDTLFIDEGFGTLSGEPLQNAIQTLRTLHTKAGRHVGIISHVEELRERIPVQIQVEQEGNHSSSQVRVVTV